MTNERNMLPKDWDDLERAARMVEDGKKLRKQVLARIRARAYRLRHPRTKPAQENALEN